MLGIVLRELSELALAQFIIYSFINYTFSQPFINPKIINLCFSLFTDKQKIQIKILFAEATHCDGTVQQRYQVVKLEYLNTQAYIIFRLVCQQEISK